jgi:PknH-like extracellular domain
MNHNATRQVGAVVVVATTATGCAAAVAGHPVLRSAPADGPPLTAAHPEALLLSDEEISTIIGKPGLTTYDSYTKMADDRRIDYPVGDRACGGALWNTLESPYRGSGYLAVAGRKVSEPGDNADHDTDQGVVLFKTADQALRYVDRSMVVWQRCAGQRVRYQLEGHHPQTWTVGLPGDAGPDIVVHNSQEAGDGYVCQHAMRAVASVVIDAWACGKDITDQGRTMVDDIAAKVHV